MTLYALTWITGMLALWRFLYLRIIRIAQDPVDEVDHYEAAVVASVFAFFWPITVPIAAVVWALVRFVAPDTPAERHAAKLAAYDRRIAELQERRDKIRALEEELGHIPLGDERV